MCLHPSIQAKEVCSFSLHMREISCECPILVKQPHDRRTTTRFSLPSADAHPSLSWSFVSSTVPLQHQVKKMGCCFKSLPHWTEKLRWGWPPQVIHAHTSFRTRGLESSHQWHDMRTRSKHTITGLQTRHTQSSPSVDQRLQNPICRWGIFSYQIKCM